MNWVPYSELQGDETGFSRLFVDYIENYGRVQPYFSADFRDEKQWRSRLQAVLEHKRNRSSIVQVLLNQNRDFHCGVRTLANIDLLLNDNTVAIVTGQQVGILGGPLYTMYKTLTALKLAEELSHRFPEYSFVPIFWLEGEDHDIDEVSSFSFLNSSNEIVRLHYEYDGSSGDRNVGAVGSVPLNASIDSLLDALQQGLIPTEFSPKVLDLLRTAYQKEMTFSKAFVHLMNVLLEDSGLIFFDPHNAETKRMLVPVFEHELKNASRTCQLVIDQSELLEQQYHAQVKPRAVNLFLFHKNGRYAIEPHAEGFSLKGARWTASQEETLNLLHSDPGLFSPNVVLRPICQDSLLPTLAYIAGPSEVSYFAQFKLLYDEFGIPEPIIYPRASVTIVEERIQKIMDKYGLRVNDFFSDIELLKGRIATSISDFKTDDLFSNTEGTIAESLTSLKGGLASIDPTLVPALENSLSKIHTLLTVLKEKTYAAQKRQHEIVLRQLEKAASSVFPRSTLQERELNIVYFLNKYGMEFLRWLRGELTIDKFAHQVINIE
jgi:bacillithiol biosynthesis cysteine-adding enzyme BshC